MTLTKDPRYADVVVIGAGIAGLTAGALLARQGYKVMVCERDVHPGGCAAGFSEAGYRFAVGATVAMGFEPGGVHRNIYDRLGLEARYVNVSPAMRVHLPDRKVELKTTHQAWLKEVIQKFPGQSQAKQAFWKEVFRLAKALYHASSRFPVMPFKHLQDVLDTAKVANLGMLEVFLRLRQTVQQRLEAFAIEDQAHQALIDGQLLDAMQTTSQHCVATNGALALDIYRYGCQYKIGGLESIAQDLATYIQSRGGGVLYSTKVKTILQEDDAIRGVSTNQGELHAPVVIGAIPLENTASLLESEALKQRADLQPEMWGAFTLYMGVDERCLPKDVFFYEQVTDVAHYHDGGNLLISISPPWDRSRAPEGKRAITVSTHVDASKWLELARDKAAYAKAKYAMEQRLLDQIERALPDIRQGIDVFKSGSPRTFQRFTLRAGGSVGGFPQTLDHANFVAPSHRTHLKGLFLAGDTIFPGQGTLGVTISGFNAARSAARFLSSKSETQSLEEAKYEYR